MRINELRPCDKMHIDEYGKGIELICQKVCDFYGVTLDQIKIHNKKAWMGVPRRVIATLCRDMFGHDCTFHLIGHYLDRDHASVITMVNKLRSELSEKTLLGRPMYPDLIKEYNHLRSDIVFELHRLDNGFDPNQPKRRNYTAHCALTKELYYELAECSKANGLTISSFLRTCVIEGVKKHKNGVPIF